MSEKNTDPATTNGWHVDKRIPVALITALVVQTFGLGYWAASLSQRVTNLEGIHASDSVRAEEINDNENRIIRVEEKIEGIQTTVSKIDLKTDAVLNEVRDTMRQVERAHHDDEKERN